MHLQITFLFFSLYFSIDDGPAHYTGTSGDYTESARGSDDSGESAHYTNDDGNNGDSYHYTSPYTYEGNANAEEGNFYFIL